MIAFVPTRNRNNSKLIELVVAHLRSTDTPYWQLIFANKLILLKVKIIFLAISGRMQNNNYLRNGRCMPVCVCPMRSPRAFDHWTIVAAKDVNPVGWSRPIIFCDTRYWPIIPVSFHLNLPNQSFVSGSISVAEQPLIRISVQPKNLSNNLNVPQRNGTVGVLENIILPVNGLYDLVVSETEQSEQKLLNWGMVNLQSRPTWIKNNEGRIVKYNTVSE